MKKYCKNCGHCVYREFASLGVNWGWFCRLKDVLTVDSVGHKTINFTNGDCENLNLDFACKDYKRVWWKWWAVK